MRINNRIVFVALLAVFAALLGTACTTSTAPAAVNAGNSVLTVAKLVPTGLNPNKPVVMVILCCDGRHNLHPSLTGLSGNLAWPENVVEVKVLSASDLTQIATKIEVFQREGYEIEVLVLPHATFPECGNCGARDGLAQILAKDPKGLALPEDLKLVLTDGSVQVGVNDQTFVTASRLSASLSQRISITGGFVETPTQMPFVTLLDKPGVQAQWIANNQLFDAITSGKPIPQIEWGNIPAATRAVLEAMKKNAPEVAKMLVQKGYLPNQPFSQITLNYTLLPQSAYEPRMIDQAVFGITADPISSVAQAEYAFLHHNSATNVTVIVVDDAQKNAILAALQNDEVFMKMAADPAWQGVLEVKYVKLGSLSYSGGEIIRPAGVPITSLTARFGNSAPAIPTPRLKQERLLAPGERELTFTRSEGEWGVISENLQVRLGPNGEPNAWKFILGSQEDAELAAEFFRIQHQRQGLSINADYFQYRNELVMRNLGLTLGEEQLRTNAGNQTVLVQDIKTYIRNMYVEGYRLPIHPSQYGITAQGKIVLLDPKGLTRRPPGFLLMDRFNAELEVTWETAFRTWQYSGEALVARSHTLPQSSQPGIPTPGALRGNVAVQVQDPPAVTFRVMPEFVMAGNVRLQVQKIPYSTYGWPNYPGVRPYVIASVSDGVPVVFYKTPAMVWSESLLRSGGLAIPEATTAQRIAGSFAKYSGATLDGAMRWAGPPGMAILIADEAWNALGAGETVAANNATFFVPVNPNNPKRDQISMGLTAMGLENSPLYAQITGKNLDLVREAMHRHFGKCYQISLPNNTAVSDNPPARAVFLLFPFLEKQLPTGVTICPGDTVDSVQSMVYTSATTGERVEWRWNAQKQGGPGFDQIGPACLQFKMWLPTNSGMQYSHMFKLEWPRTQYPQVWREKISPTLVDQPAVCN